MKRWRKKKKEEAHPSYCEFTPTNKASEKQKKKRETEKHHVYFESHIYSSTHFYNLQLVLIYPTTPMDSLSNLRNAELVF